MTDLPVRSAAERVRDALAMLEAEVDCWVGTASADGSPHLVPLSFAWERGKITLATPWRYRTVRNLLENGRVKVALGALRDVVLVDGTAVVRDLTDVPDESIEEYALQGGWDPRHSEGNAFIEVTPQRVLVWRHEAELDGRVVMRGGEWVETGGAA